MDTLDYIKKNYTLTRAYTGETEIADVTREDLAILCNLLGFKKGVEVGVAAGIYSSTILQHNPQMHLYSIDPWSPYRGYSDYTKESTFTQLRTEAEARLKRFPNSTIIRKFSMDALSDFEDESLDFVYLDANHRKEFVWADVNEWSKKVRPGGIVAGDDYARIKGRDGAASSNWAVIPAIQEYTATNGYQLFIWGLSAKIPKLKRNDVRSWSFVKK